MSILMLSVMGAFAEFERALIRESQWEGWKRSLSSEQIIALRQQVSSGAQKSKIAREFDISRETLYQYLRSE